MRDPANLGMVTRSRPWWRAPLGTPGWAPWLLEGPSERSRRSWPQGWKQSGLVRPVPFFVSLGLIVAAVAVSTVTDLRWLGGIAVSAYGTHNLAFRRVWRVVYDYVNVFDRSEFTINAVLVVASSGFILIGLLAAIGVVR
jgi:hypothetical protein